MTDYVNKPLPAGTVRLIKPPKAVRAFRWWKPWTWFRRGWDVTWDFEFNPHGFDD